MQVYTGIRVFDSDNYIMTQDYSAHRKAVEAGGYAMGVDLVPTNADGTYVEHYVVAHTDGTVMYADEADGYGNAVWVKTGQYLCGYAHLKCIMVSVGQYVRKGTVLGVVGTTGHSTGIHLHFSLRVLKEGKAIRYSPFDLWGAQSFLNADNFTWVDPTPYLNADLPTLKEPKVIYRVQVGAYKFKVFAKSKYKQLQQDGYSPICKYYDGLYHIQVGAFEIKAYANSFADELQEKGYTVFITSQDGQDVTL